MKGEKPMAIAIEAPTKTSSPVEEFPFDSYALVEGRIQTLRLLIMKTAASLAASEASPSAGRVKVSRAHIMEALKALAEKTDIVRSVLLTGETTVK
jgi:hypothetical protein